MTVSFLIFIRVFLLKPNNKEPELPNIKDNSTQKIVILSITTGFFAMLAIVFGIINFLPGRDSGQSGSGDSGSSSSQDDSDDDYSPPINTNTVEGYQEVNSLLETLVLNVGKNSTPIATNSNVEIFYVPDGLKSHVSLRLSLARTIDSNLEKVKSNLESQGFILVGEMPHATSAPMPTAYEYVNVSKDMVCGIYSVTNEKTGGEGVYTSCGKTSWTWLTDEEKNTISELEEAYFEKNGEYPKKIDSITLKIKDSRFKPYQTAVVSTTGNSFFYRTSPNSKWQYFRTSLVAATCDEYNTDDLRKAYLGEVCYTGENNTVPSTVQL